MPNPYFDFPAVLASLTWQQDLQAWVFAAIGIFLFVLFWAYQGKPGSGLVKATCTTFKLLAVALLLACILEPRWMRESILPRANTIAIILDNSDSLNIQDAPEGETRLEATHKVLSNAESTEGWIPALEKDFQIQRFLLGDQLQPIQSFKQGLPAPSQTTPLQTALEHLQSRFSRQPLATVILLSDGQSTQALDESTVKGLPPVHTIPASTAASPPDLAIQDVRITQSQFEDAPVTIEANLKTQGFQGRTLTVQLLDPEGKTVESETRGLPQKTTPQTLRFQFNPKTTGIAFYQLRVAEEVTEGETPLQEATGANNQLSLAIHQPSQPFRVLYLAGRPNWEYKFLRRALHEEDKLHLVGLIRVAKKEARFEFRGREGESSNPLFRGFKDQNDGEEEQYDEPVLIRLNTRDKEELLNGFPDTAEELYPYHAVILDDIESSFFTRAQHSLLDKYVSERGGGLLVLGGQETYQEGGYQKTPIGDILPLYLGTPGKGSRLPGEAEGHWNLTREGWLTPWARLRSTESEERTVQAEIPPFLVHNPTNGLKPGATLLATIDGPSNPGGAPLPALVEQRLGKGRVISSPVGDLWRWAMKAPGIQPEHQKFWRQTLRHLLADVPEPTTLQIHPSEDPADPAVQIELIARSEEFIPQENAKPQLQITTPDGKESLLPLEASDTQSATWHARHLPLQTGAYHVKATLLGEDGITLLSTTKSGWASHHPAQEHKDHTPNQALLQKVATLTGGQFLQLQDLPALAKELPKQQAPVMHEWSKPLWHNPWIVALIIALLAAEWGLRKKNQLA